MGFVHMEEDVFVLFRLALFSFPLQHVAIKRAREAFVMVEAGEGGTAQERARVG